MPESLRTLKASVLLDFGVSFLDICKGFEPI